MVNHSTGIYWATTMCWVPGWALGIQTAPFILLHCEKRGFREGILSLLLSLPCVFASFPNKTREEGSVSHLSHLPSVFVSNPPLNTPLINFLINLSCPPVFFVLPWKHSQASQLHVYSPLPLNSLLLWLHSQALEDIMFLCSAELNQTRSMLSDLSAFQWAAPSPLCLPLVSFFV